MSPTCAYLGPDGSYTSQASRTLLTPEATLIPCTTITDVFAAETTYAVVPLENTIHGVVQETLECLLGEARRGWSMVRTYDKPIQHALVVSRGTRLEDVRWVASHEQALGQCAGFLRETFPAAKIIPVSSTALAAHTIDALSHHHHANGNSCAHPTTSVAPIPDALKDLPGAAICSVELANSLAGLQVARESIQDIEDNHTRFMLLRRRTASANGDETNASSEPATSFYRIDDPRTLTALLGNPSTILVAIHSKAFPLQSTYTKPNGHDKSHARGLQEVQERYAEKYNKRYLVEVAAAHEGVPGIVRL